MYLKNCKTKIKLLQVARSRVPVPDGGLLYLFNDRMQQDFSHIQYVYEHTPTFAILNTNKFAAFIIFAAFCYICLASVSIT